MNTIQLRFLAAAVLLSVSVSAQTSTAKKSTTTAAPAKTSTTTKTVTTAKTTPFKAKTSAKKKTTKSAATSTVTKTATAVTTPTSATNGGATINFKPVTGNNVVVVSPTQMSAKTETSTTPANTQSVAPGTGSTNGGKGASMGGSTTTSNSTGNTTTTTTNTGTTPTGKGGSMGGTTTTTTNSTTTTGGNILTDVLGGGTGDITQLDAASAIKDALSKGITTGVNKVSVTDGYFGNSLIKIPFPQDVQIVESTLRSFGMGGMIDDLVLSLNRSAEQAAGQAGPIFLNSIKQMTITDALNIVGNQQPDAATQFLQRVTTESLVGAFKPSIKGALDKTLATKYWSDITGYYNKIPFVSPVNSDLPDYVTRKAISGLFVMIAQEEAKIRKNPVATGSAIVDKVFGAFKK